LGANQFSLSQLGTIYLGQSQPGLPTNTSVLVVFSGTVGYVVPNGFLVGDGTYSYQVQGGGVIGALGSSLALTALATQSGSWGIPPNTVTVLLTSAPTGVALTVTNPSNGTPGGTGETWYAFRARILQAGLAACVGSARFIKTLISETGVAGNLISVQSGNPGIRVIVGGGDYYQIAYAIFCSVADPSVLVGSAISPLRNVTAALYDYPNTYPIVYVNPDAQILTLVVTWNTVLTPFTGGGGFPSLTQGPLAAYINAIAIGQPINILEMNAIFQTAVSGVLDPTLLTRLVFSVYINGVLTPAGSGTYAVTGDPEGYFTAVTTGITVLQG
jgi:hypothetical protein